MLNKIKKQILLMLDTLGDALMQYLAQPVDDLLDGINQFIDTINVPIKSESGEVIALSKQLKSSLKNPMLSEIERVYNEYCTAIESLPVQYKAVFLPYYDNTWDSLASVYEAFDADPMFVTEIIIIPIRRNTPTGWKMVYEDYLTPKGIPNTPFSSYSFENDLPDFVFYNNPYDGVNIEQFQSHIIKPYVGYMVYVPYFLLTDFYMTTEQLKKNILRMTELPGHDCSDLLVVQGDWFIKKYSTRSKNKGKMVALGNPKADNIFSARNLGLWEKRPDWENVIKGKRTFLLNTHYTLANTENEETIRFLNYFFDFILKNNDAALIWRPHPQTFLMLHNRNDEPSRRLNQYFDIVKNSNRMIFDLTPSIVPSFMYCDAFISTSYSSTVSEAIVFDKPVFLCWYGQKKNSPMHDAVSHLGYQDAISEDKESFQHIWIEPFYDFLTDIMNGVDHKKMDRENVRNRMYVNIDGTCGQQICEYLKKHLLNKEF